VGLCGLRVFRQSLARFLENHDEPRAAVTFALPAHAAAAVVTFLSPGLRFFHQGQFEGRRKRISPHLVRGPAEQPDRDLEQFYTRLLAILRHPTLRHGEWRLLEAVPAWSGNDTHDQFIAFAWEHGAGDRFLVVVNYAPIQSQCRLPLPWSIMAGCTVRLQDQLSSEVNDRSGTELQSPGLFLVMKPWQAAVYTFHSPT